MKASDQRWHQQPPALALYYFLRKRRRVLAPLFLSAAVGGMGLLGWWQRPWLWPLGLVAGALPSVVIAFASTKWWSRRYYHFLAAAAFGLVCTSLWFSGPRLPVLEGWAGVTAVASVLWWWHRWASWGRVKTRQAGRAPERVRAWWQARLWMWHWRRKIGEGEVRSVTCDEHGHTLHLLAPGTVIADIKVDRWESQLRLSQGLMRVTQGEKAHRFDVRILHRDPLARPLVYPGGVKATVRSGIRLGRFEDGRMVRLTVREKHILIAGVTGAGKSGTVNALLAELAWCPDVELWGGDLKGGMELGPWRERFSRLEVTVALVEEMLSDLLQTIESRTYIIRNRAKGKRSWYPTERDPQIVVVIEEVARLARPGLELLEQVAMIGRALGVTLVCTTQQPSARILGSTVLRSQLTTRIALRVGEKNEIGMVLDKGMDGQGWRPDRLRHPGSFLIHSDEHTTPMPARAWLVDDETVEEIVAATKQLRPGRPALKAIGG